MTQSMTARVLMTCVGGTLAPDLLMHLRADQGLITRLVGADASPAAIGRAYVDAFYEVPFGDAPGYVGAILDLVARERVNVILPGSDQEAFALSSSRDRLAAAGAALLTSPAPVLELIRDKEATYRTLESAGIEVPARRVVDGVKGLRAALGELGYPDRSLIVKPTAARGGRGLRVLIGRNDSVPDWIGGGTRETRLDTQPDRRTMDGWFAAGSLMVMPVLRDPAYDVDILAVRGTASHALVRQRKNPPGIPFTGNLLIPDGRIRDYCLAMAEAIGLDGLHDIDLMTDGDGNPALLEINPRMSGSAVASHAAGFPIVSAAIAAAVGVDYPIGRVTEQIEVNLIPRAVREPCRSATL